MRRCAGKRPVADAGRAPYVKTMRLHWLAIVLALTLVHPGISVRAQTGERDYNIMVPEKGSKSPAHKVKRRGSSTIVAPAPLPLPLHYVPPPSMAVEPSAPAVPPSLLVPQTNSRLPNLPTVSPSGPRGSETRQDRAVRCAHQAGVYGNNAGEPNAYIGSCINQ